MNLEKGNREALSARWIIAVILVHVALLFVVFNRAAAQTAPPSDEVYRIVIAKDVGDKEGRDHRLMLETLGYIPVHMQGDFAGGHGVVLLGNFPTQKEAQKIKEQLVRDGFLPLEIIKTIREKLASGRFTVLAGWFSELTTATEQKKRLENAGLLRVQIKKNEATGQFAVTVGNFTSIDQANTVVAAIKNSHGFAKAAIVDATNLETVVSDGLLNNAPARVTASDVRKSSGRELSEAEIA